MLFLAFISATRFRASSSDGTIHRARSTKAGEV